MSSPHLPHHGPSKVRFAPEPDKGLGLHGTYIMILRELEGLGVIYGIPQAMSGQIWAPRPKSVHINETIKKRSFHQITLQRPKKCNKPMVCQKKVLQWNLQVHTKRSQAVPRVFLHDRAAMVSGNL